MAKASPLMPAFNGGEWSPLLEGRTDLVGYGASGQTIENFLPTVQGPLVRRGGYAHVRQVKDSADRTWLIPFVRSRSLSYMLEFGDQYVRFYFGRAPVLTGSGVSISGISAASPGVVTTSGPHGYANGQDVFLSGIGGAAELNLRWFIVANVTSTTFELTTVHGEPVDTTAYGAYTSGGTVDAPYELASPYSADDLVSSKGELNLDYVQSRDVLYIAHRGGDYALRSLTRTSPTSWAFATVDPDDGPFLDLNSTATTLYTSGASGTVTLTASASIFTPDHVGALIRLDQETLTAVAPWATSKAYTAGDFARSEGKEYVAVTSGTSGTSIPAHTSGTVSDGGVEWQYVSAGYGIARVVSQSGTTATATVLTTFPQTLIGLANASTFWRVGSWSGVGSYPTTVRFDRERLVTASQDRIEWSVTADFGSFALDSFGEVLATSAISLTLQSEQSNDVVGLVEGPGLTILAEGGEFTAQKITTTEVFGPGNVELSPGTTFGSRPVRPLRIGEAVIVIQASGKKVRELTYEIQVDGQVSRDLTVRSEHLARLSPLIGMTRQQEPYQLVWFPRADGQEVVFAYDRTQEVRGFTRCIPGGADAKTECMASIPSPDGGRDDVWRIVSRTVNGATRRYVEYMRPEFETGDRQVDAFYVDAGLTYDGAPASTIYGYDHLEGEVVRVLADGAAHPDVTVTAGAITLQRPASVVQAGLSTRARYASFRIEQQTREGTAQMKTKRITDVGLRVLNTLGGRIGPTFDLMDDVPDLNYRLPSTPMDTATPLFTGDTRPISMPGGYETDGRVCYENDTAYPCTIIAIQPQVETAESR